MLVILIYKIGGTYLISLLPTQFPPRNFNFFGRFLLLKTIFAHFSILFETSIRTVNREFLVSCMCHHMKIFFSDILH